MKKFVQPFLLAAIAACICSACNKFDSSDFADQASFATVRMIGSGDYCLLADDGQTLYPGDRSRVASYTPEEGRRVIVSFKYLDLKIDGYDRNIALYSIQNILTGETTPDADSGLATDPISFYAGQIDGSHVNMSIGLRGTDAARHRFTLAYALDEADPGYVYLYLYHDAGEDSASTDFMQNYLSFRLPEEVNEWLQSRSGAVLQVNTYESGIKNVRIWTRSGQTE